jgi:SAM-dependent methyltransferase
MDGLTRALVEAMAAVFQPPGPVLEIGSRQVQGLALADLRPLFPGSEYVGCDMEPGPGVDRIERIEALSFADGWAGTVLCLNVLEHAWAFERGLAEVVRVTAAGGLALVTTAFDIGIHGFPDDYWRFTPRALARLFEPFPTVLYGWQGHPKSPRLVFALGLKREVKDAAFLAEAWRRQARRRWTEAPALRVRIGAAIGGLLFSKRLFRRVRHWWDLTICPARREGNP